MVNTKYIVIGIIFIIWTGLAVYSGYSFKKCKCPEQKDSTYTIPLPPQQAHLEIKKPGKPFKPVKDGIVLIDSSHSFQTYNEIIDSIVTFNSDSLDFVAQISFNDSLKYFENTFDFQLRTKKIIEEVIKEVPIMYEPEFYQDPLFIISSLIIAFLLGVII